MDSAFRNIGEGAGLGRPGTFTDLPYSRPESCTFSFLRIFIQRRGQVILGPRSVNVVNTPSLIHPPLIHYPLHLNASSPRSQGAPYDRFSYREGGSILIGKTGLICEGCQNGQRETRAYSQDDRDLSHRMIRTRKGKSSSYFLL